MSRELVSSLQHELSSLPESELNQSTRDQILQMVTRVVPKVQENYQTANSVDHNYGTSGPYFNINGPSLTDIMPQVDLSIDGTLTIGNPVPGMYADMSPIPWVGNIGSFMPPYGTDFSDSSQLYQGRRK